MKSSEGILRPFAVKFSETAKVPTHLFIREHKNPEEPEQDTKAALFVAGLPVLHHPLQTVLQALFSAFGELISVTLHQSQLSALVVFQEQSAVDNVLQICASGQVVEVPLAEPTQPYGLKGWLRAHQAQFPGNEELKKQLDEWMEDFEAKEEAAKLAAAAKDDDGWTVVTRKPGRKKNTDTATGIAVGGVSKVVAERRLSQKPVKQLTNFYTHQRREKQRADLVSLQRRFEADKQRIAEMKAARKFKPG